MSTKSMTTPHFYPLIVELQIACEDPQGLPTTDQFNYWVQQAVQETIRPNLELTIRIVDEEEMQELNRTYRHQDKTTNVLSFPFYNEFLFEDVEILGDLVICRQVVEQEATTQQIDLMAHWAHLTVHGCLHLLGYDHIQDDEADIMENKETKIMQDMGFTDPYLSEK